MITMQVIKKVTNSTYKVSDVFGRCVIVKSLIDVNVGDYVTVVSGSITSKSNKPDNRVINV